VEETTLYLRLGGASGVDALVRKLHQRLRGDAELADLTDQLIDDRCHEADTRLLAQIIGADDVSALDTDLRNRGVLLLTPEVVRRHLRDALWLLGISTSLAEQVLEAVSRAQGQAASGAASRDVAR
jgi:hypothetical protein